jgi:hypothetical protein
MTLKRSEAKELQAPMFHARVALHRMPALKDMGGVKSAERQLLA